LNPCGREIKTGFPTPGDKVMGVQSARGAVKEQADSAFLAKTSRLNLYGFVRLSSTCLPDQRSHGYCPVMKNSPVFGAKTPKFRHMISNPA
jgi:hypothetical protein